MPKGESCTEQKELAKVNIFIKEYLCKWTLSEEYKKAYELWIWYEYQCEIYDKTICTGRCDRDGYIIPILSQEKQLINSNAYKLHRYIEEMALNYHVSKDNWFSAKRDVERLTWEGIQREYKRIYESE